MRFVYASANTKVCVYFLLRDKDSENIAALIVN